MEGYERSTNLGFQEAEKDDALPLSDLHASGIRADGQKRGAARAQPRRNSRLIQQIQMIKIKLEPQTHNIYGEGKEEIGRAHV